MNLIDKYFKTDGRKFLIDKYCISRGRGLDLGSYEHKLTYDNAIGVDIKKNKNVGILHDLNKPFKFAKNDSQDFVFAGEIIEHLLNSDLFLNECKRVLKKDGVLVLTTWNARSLFTDGIKSEHLLCFEKYQIEERMKRLGFEIIESGYVNLYKRNLIKRFLCFIRPTWRWWFYVVGKNKNSNTNSPKKK